MFYFVDEINKIYTKKILIYNQIVNRIEREGERLNYDQKTLINNNKMKNLFFFLFNLFPTYTCLFY